MNSTFLKGAAFGGVVTVVALLSSAALAGTGVGGVFNLGQSNAVNAPTTLTGATASSQLKVANTSTALGASGIGITVATGKPPLAVNSATQVKNLNANFLQGKAANAFLPANGTAANANALGGLFPSSFMQGTGSVHGGQLTVSNGDAPSLGPVGNLGRLGGFCAAGGFSVAGVEFIANNTNSGAVLKVGDGSQGFGTIPPGTTALLTPDTVDFFGTTQFSLGNETATVTITVVADSFTFPSGTCVFAVQVIDSNG
jgi:hypothetical protein